MSTFTIKKVKKTNLKDLISLIWPVNTCYSTLIAGVPKGVTVDTMTETWTFKKQTQPIGSPIGSRSDGRAITGHPIGVYDKTKLEHIKAMKCDIEWVKERDEEIPIDA